MPSDGWMDEIAIHIQAGGEAKLRRKYRYPGKMNHRPF